MEKKGRRWFGEGEEVDEEGLEDKEEEEDEYLELEEEEEGIRIWREKEDDLEKDGK